VSAAGAGAGSDTPLPVVVTGGGTGGHLYPGLAIARALVRAEPRVRPFFVGARRGIERDVLPTTEFPHLLLDLHPVYRQRPWENWRTLAGGVRAWRSLAALFAAERPLAVVGTGGYAAGAALAYAVARGVPTALQEADSFPGLTTRVFARRAADVFVGFPEAAERLSPGPSTRVHAFGNPIEPPSPARPTRAEARARWGLPPDAALVVLAFGGSQGARALNEALDAWVAAGLPEGVALIWATGRAQHAPYAGRDGAAGGRVRVVPYLAPIADAYAAADLALTRAGAMSIAELCAWGLPSVLVPLPTAAADHQAHNARALAAAGAAIHLPQAELNAATLDGHVRALATDTGRLRALAVAAAARGRPDAAARIADQILRSVRGTAGAEAGRAPIAVSGAR
jgi:UDP-N-acetylglucosamine--N-acetylmuramyl-(pentapeptide) pyrophosphoryl-undecaprenol N-acetylglucosamine transferase